MDDESPDATAVASPIKLENSSSKIGHRGRLFAMADKETSFTGGRSDWAARWQHPLVKSIQTRRGKASRW
jgi:hypothetical protein